MNEINFYGPSKFSCFVLNSLHCLGLQLTYRADGTWLLKQKNSTLGKFMSIQEVKEQLKKMMDKI